MIPAAFHCRRIGTLVLAAFCLHVVAPTFFVLLPSTFAPPRAEAAVGIYKPIHYQGKIALPSGVAPTDGPYNMRFKIFTGSLLGSPVWTETWDDGSQVTMTGGLFSVPLGSITAMTGSVNFNSDSLYLQVEFDPDASDSYAEVFTPRRRLGSVPFAHNADMLDGLNSSQFLRSDTGSTMSGGTLNILTEGLGLNVHGTMSGSAIQATDILASSGVLIVKKKSGTNTGVILAVDTNGLVYDASNKRVGIGTAAPSSMLELNTESIDGNETILRLVSDVAGDEDTAFRVTANGSIYTDQGQVNTGGADYAEWFRSSTHDLQKKEVVCIDPRESNTVRRCDRDADTNVMGIISSHPGFVGNVIAGADGIMPPGYVLVGLIGQVDAFVSAENGSIHAGDALTPAQQPGYARRANAGEPTVGVALEPLLSGVGIINVLISRRNQSLTVDLVEDKVLENIRSLAIEDTIDAFVADSVRELTGTGSSLFASVREQMNGLDLRGRIREVLLEMSGSLLRASSQSLLDFGSGASLHTSGLSVLGNTVMSGSVAARGTLTAGALVSESTLLVSGDTSIGGDLFLGGVLRVQDLLVPGIMQVDGGLRVGTMMAESGSIASLSVERLHAGSGSHIAGTLIVDGNLRVATGSLSFATGSLLDVGDFFVKGTMKAMGDVTFEGLAMFLSDVSIAGQLTVSNRHAGYAEIEVGGTGAIVAFPVPFTATPVVTASPDVPVLYSVSKATSTGFVIRLQAPTPEVITFSWLALPTTQPLVANLVLPDAVLLPFFVDEHGMPLTGNFVADGCIRNQVPLDSEGRPYNCSRYHTGPDWEVDGVQFTWNTVVTPPLLTVPDGYEIVAQTVEEEADDSVPEGETASGEVLTGSGETMSGTVIEEEHDALLSDDAEETEAPESLDEEEQEQEGAVADPVEDAVDEAHPSDDGSQDEHIGGGDLEHAPEEEETPLVEWLPAASSFDEDSVSAPVPAPEEVPAPADASNDTGW